MGRVIEIDAVPDEDCEEIILASEVVDLLSLRGVSGIKTPKDC